MQLARFRLDSLPPDDRDADGVLDPGDRCPGVYVPGGDGPDGCPPPFYMRVTLRWQKPSIVGRLAGGDVNCLPERLGIYRARPGADRRIRWIADSNYNLADNAFSGPFRTSFAHRFGPLERGGRLYVRVPPDFDPSVGDCDGDRSKVVTVPPRGERRN